MTDLSPEEAQAQADAEMADAYLRITGLPIWWDSFTPEAKRARRKWQRWLEATNQA